MTNFNYNPFSSTNGMNNGMNNGFGVPSSNPGRIIRNAQVMENNPDLDAVLTGNFLGLDTSSLLVGNNARQHFWFNYLREAMVRTGRSVFIPYEVYEEVERKQRDADAELRVRAVNALAFLHELNDAGRLVVFEKLNARESFADQAFLSLAMNARHSGRDSFALVTQDGRLAFDLMALNDIGSSVGMPVRVYRVKGHGTLGCFDTNSSTWGQGVRPRTMPMQSARPGQIQPAAQPMTSAAQPMTSAAQPMRPMTHAQPMQRPAFRAPDTQVGMLTNHLPFDASRRAEQPELPAGTRLHDDSGATLELGECIAQGGESYVHRVRGREDLLVKIIRQPSARKRHKVRMLMQAARQESFDAAVMPREMLYLDEKRTRFVGFVMPRLDESWTPMSEVIAAVSPEHDQYGWKRHDFVAAARRVLTMHKQLHERGLALVDARMENLFVGRDADGRLCPDKLMFIDVDSAQLDGARFGSPELGVIPYDGYSPWMTAPELVSVMNDTSTLISESAYAFIAGMQAFMLCMVGAHPYQAMREDGDGQPERTLTGALERGLCPYRAKDIRGMVNLKPPRLYELRFSNAPQGWKMLYASMFNSMSDRFDPARRPGFEEQIQQTTYYLNWIVAPKTNVNFPEADLLFPQASKRFTRPCVCCGTPALLCPADAQRTPEHGLIVAGQVYCPACARQYRPGA